MNYEQNITTNSIKPEAESYNLKNSLQEIDAYTLKLEHSLEQSRQGKVVVKSIEELEAMES